MSCNESVQLFVWQYFHSLIPRPSGFFLIRQWDFTISEPRHHLQGLRQSNRVLLSIRNGNLFSFYTLFLFFRLHNHKIATLISRKTDHFFHTHWPTSSADIGGRPKPTNWMSRSRSTRASNSQRESLWRNNRKKMRSLLGHSPTSTTVWKWHTIEAKLHPRWLLSIPLHSYRCGSQEGIWGASTYKGKDDPEECTSRLLFDVKTSVIFWSIDLVIYNVLL